MDLIRVVLADDDAAVRESVETILAAADIDVIARAADGVAAIRAAEEHRPDVLLLDIRMPGLDGLTVARRVRDRVPGVAIVMLTTFGEDTNVDDALAVGVQGFLLKSSAPTEIISAVRAAATGGVTFSAAIAGRLAARLTPRSPRAVTISPDRLAALTARDRDVLNLIATGRSNAEIASALHLTENTVKGYVSALLDRLGVRNRVEAALIGATAAT